MTRRNMLNLLLLLSLLLPSLSAAAQGYAQQAQQAYEQSRRLKDMDDFPNALSAIQCAVRLMPDSDIYWDWMSWCEFLLGLHAEGEEHALRSVRLNPQNPEHYMLVGLNAQGNQDFDLARDYFRRTLSFGPQRMRPDQYADATRRLEYLMGKKYTLFWKLDANQAPQPTVSLPLPSDQPYQTCTYTVTGLENPQVSVVGGNRMLTGKTTGAPIRLTVTVTVRPVKLRHRKIDSEPDLSPYLQTSAQIDPQSLAVKQVIDTLPQTSKDPEEKIRYIRLWLKQNMSYLRPPFPPGYFQSVDELISSHRAECGGYSALFTALCRAWGIPAREVWVMATGSEFAPKDSMKGHAIAEVYLPNMGGWAPVEPQQTDSLGVLPNGYVRICHHDPVINRWQNSDLTCMGGDTAKYNETVLSVEHQQ